MTLTTVASLEDYRATIGPHGRVVVPAPIRKALNWDEGTVLTFVNEDGRIVLSDQRVALRRFQEYAQSLIPEGSDVLEDFLLERRTEALKEATQGSE